MRLTTYDSFKREAYDNFGKYCSSWGHGNRGIHAANSYFRVAYQIYKHVFNANMDVILLGDTGIREQKENILNFSLLSATAAAQEDSGKRIANKIKKERRKITRGPSKPRPTKNPLYEEEMTDPVTGDVRNIRLYDTWDWKAGPVSVWKNGSILSTVGWSPLLNDTMMLAGAERRIDFIFTLTLIEQSIFRQCAALQEADAEPKDKWKMFFLRNSKSLWDSNSNLPRVFVRELLALQHFGYKTQIKDDQMSFFPGAINTNRITTLGTLNDFFLKVGYYKRADAEYDKRRILRSVSMFLFGDADELSEIY